MIHERFDRSSFDANVRKKIVTSNLSKRERKAHRFVYK